MKNQKIIFLCVLAGVLSCSGCLSVKAESMVDSGKLKSGLLLNERDNYQYNIFDYNTNNDQNVNVLDLCRSKAFALEKYGKKTQSINISCLRPWVTSDSSIITIPVNIKGNTEGVSALSFYAGYNTQYFKLDSAYSSYGNVVYSSENNYVQFSSYDGQNITDEGNIVYLVFSAANDVPYATYNFELSQIQGTVLGTDGLQRELSDEEYNSDSARLEYTFSRGNSRPDVTTTPNTTTATTSATTETTVSQTEPQSGDKLSFSMDNAELSSDGNRLRIPVYMQMNTTGLCSFNAIIKYDTDRFSLSGVSQGDFSGYGYVGGNKDNAVFSTFNNQNINDRSGIIAVLEFDVNDGYTSGTYDFELTDIYAYYSENWSQQEVPRDKRNDRSEVYRYSHEGTQITTTPEPWTPPVTTTTVTEPWVPPVTTTTVTEPWVPPVTTTTVTEPWIPPVTTTTVTEPWIPPVTTITERPVDPPVTTTDPGSRPGLNPEKSPEEIELLNLILEYRRSLGLSELQEDDTLFYCCDIRAEELTRSYGSERPDGSSRADLLKEYGSDGWIGSCEIRTKGTNDANTVLSRIKNIMSSNPNKYVGNPEYRYIGVGCYDGYWSIIITE